MTSPRYQRVIVKISGQLLRHGDHTLARERLSEVAVRLQSLHAAGVQTAVVIGGGNIVRGAHASELHAIERVTADHMGMLATVINGLALMDTLEKIGIETRVMSALPMDRLAEPYILRRATRHLEKGRIVIFVSGTGNPFFSTDTAAALRGSELGAQLLIKATKVDGVYDTDPLSAASAPGKKTKKSLKPKKFDHLSFTECLKEGYHVMDATAFTLCRENNLPIVVLDLFEKDSLLKAASGQKIGTLIR